MIHIRGDTISVQASRERRSLVQTSKAYHAEIIQSLDQELLNSILHIQNGVQSINIPFLYNGWRERFHIKGSTDDENVLQFELKSEWENHLKLLYLTFQLAAFIASDWTSNHRPCHATSSAKCLFWGDKDIWNILPWLINFIIF